MTDLSGVTVILPSYNPDEKLMKTVNSLIDAGFTDIVLINDGSRPENDKNFPPKGYPCCTILNHWLNRGKGAGLKTAFAYVLKTRPHALGVVTADGDGQHKAADVRACALKMLEKNKVVLGCRNFSLAGIPARSVFGNKMTAFVLKWLCGIKVSDTQTGLRAIPREYLSDMLSVKGDRFEYETNMLLAFKENDIPFAEQSIETVYIEENKTSHFNPLRDSIRIYKQIFAYLFSSLSATAIDLGVFTVLYTPPLFFGGSIDNLTVCVVIARIISSIYNYFINFRFVFKKKKSGKYTLFKYFALVVVIMLLSALSLEGVAAIIPSSAVLYYPIVKMIIDTLLAVISFMAQREWVFGGKKKNER